MRNHKYPLSVDEVKYFGDDMILIGVWLLRTSHAIGSRDVKSSLRQAKLPNGQVHYQYKDIMVNNGN